MILGDFNLHPEVVVHEFQFSIQEAGFGNFASALPDNPFGVKSIPAFGGAGKRRTPSPDNPFGTPAAALAATAAVTRLRAATVAVPGADNPFAAPPSALKGNPFRR